MKMIWKENKAVWLVFALIWISFFIWVMTFGKQDSFLLINLFHFPILDTLIPYSTYLGDGFFAIFVVLLLGFKNYRSTFIVLTSFLVSGALAQFFKGVVFPDMLRPIAYFEQFGLDIHTIDGITMRRMYSFPSGHTTSAFALFFSLIILIKNKGLHFLFLGMAILAAYSRIYLGQHFPEDVLAGSVLGTTVAIFTYFFWQKPKWKFLSYTYTKSKA